MFFIRFTLGFVAVVMTCLIMINRWMVSKRPKAPDSRDQTDDPHHDPTHDSAHHKGKSADLKDG